MPDLDPNTSEYFRQREQRERELARHAPNPAVRNIHLELAKSYCEQANALELALGDAGER